MTICGERRPVSFYREIVFGLRREPYIAVIRPENADISPVTTPWSWSDSVSSWSFDGLEGHPLTVEVYTDAEEAALYLNGELIERKKTVACKAEFSVPYRDDGIDAKEPNVSPFYGDYSGFPPMYFTADQGEVLFDDSALLVPRIREQGVEVAFDVYEDTFHSFPTIGKVCPESAEAMKRTCSFIARHLG